MTLIVWTLVLCVLMYGPVTEACPSRCSCNRSTSCNGAFVNCLLKGLTEVPFYIPTNTCELNLNGNNITTLEDSAFDMLSSLRKL
ncbi:slit homolog 2 protein-like [Saccostrea cucullata]|uniref:slit homolog 2 protein-like n=1 Tax=Saccostrea cuccullata TaxID=36930 RepID=UPI002ECFBD15